MPILTVDISYPRRTRDWNEAQHPRGQSENAGEFVAKHQRVAQHVATHTRHAATATVGAVKRFGHEDYTILHEHLHSVKDEDRKRVAHRIRLMAKAVPHLVRSHVREERQHAVHAAQALHSLMKGQKPAPHEIKGLYSFGARALMTSASLAVGDPTGTVGHLAAQFGHELVQHVILEHAVKLFVGAGKVMAGAFRSPAKDELGGEDEELLRRFLNALADSVETISEAEAEQILSGGHTEEPFATPFGDKFIETEHPRGQPENAGEFAKTEMGEHTQYKTGNAIKDAPLRGNELRMVNAIVPRLRMLPELKHFEVSRVPTSGFPTIVAGNEYTSFEELDENPAGVALVLYPGKRQVEVWGITNQLNAKGLGERMVKAVIDSGFKVIVDTDVSGGFWKHIQQKYPHSVILTEDKFIETEHPRGQPENAGEFTTKGGQTTRPGFQSAKIAEGGARIPIKGGKMPEHIKSLRIPPAWSDVQFSIDPKNSVWVVGKDAKGRPQCIQNPKFARTQAEAKFRRIKELAGKFDAIQRQNAKNRQSKDQRTRDLADCAHLIMQTGIRPGSEDDTGAEKQAYGATTLMGQHVVPSKDGVTLQFVGKKGVSLSIPVPDKDTAKMLMVRAEAAGSDGKLFPEADDKRLLAYVHSFDGGGFKTKDMRTLVGTRTAIDEVARVAEQPTDAKSYKKAVTAVAKVVAAKLGNTPAVALQAYISPVVFAKWKLSAGV